jgi:hypothetical protein
MPDKSYVGWIRDERGNVNMDEKAVKVPPDFAGMANSQRDMTVVHGSASERQTESRYT